MSLRSRNPAVALIRFLLLAVGLMVGSAIAGSAEDLPQAAAESAATGRPIMIIFGTADCAYCARMKREFLHPRLRQGGLQQKVVIREVDIEASGKIADFDGLPIRNSNFVHRYGVFATPTVVLMDASGKVLASPLAGYSDAVDYAQRLDQAIATARRALRPGARYP